MNDAAEVKRGIITGKDENGYIVKSYSDGFLTTPPLPCPFAALDVGSKVYYFMFDDGTGLILAKF